MKSTKISSYICLLMTFSMITLNFSFKTKIYSSLNSLQSCNQEINPCDSETTPFFCLEGASKGKCHSNENFFANEKECKKQCKVEKKTNQTSVEQTQVDPIPQIPQQVLIDNPIPEEISTPVNGIILDSPPSLVNVPDVVVVDPLVPVIETIDLAPSVVDVPQEVVVGSDVSLEPDSQPEFDTSTSPPLGVEPEIEVNSMRDTISDPLSNRGIKLVNRREMSHRKTKF